MLGFVLITAGLVAGISSIFLDRNQYRGPHHIYSYLPWTEEYLDSCIQIFFKEWIKKYPKDENKLIKMMNNLEINWLQSRIIASDSIAFGVIDSTKSVRIWIGPRIRGKGRSILHTSLLSQLIILSNLATGKTDLETKGILYAAAGTIRQIEKDTHSISR